jgi:hypothetical protein
LVAAALLVGAPSLSFADDGDDVSTRGACKAELDKSCKDIKPGDGRLARCLKDHVHDLGQPCQSELGKYFIAVFEKACHTDIDRVCKNVQPGGGRILDCLRTNSAQLSPACKQLVTAAPKH